VILNEVNLQVAAPGQFNLTAESAATQDFGEGAPKRLHPTGCAGGAQTGPDIVGIGWSLQSLFAKSSNPVTALLARSGEAAHFLPGCAAQISCRNGTKRDERGAKVANQACCAPACRWPAKRGKRRASVEVALRAFLVSSPRLRRGTAVLYVVSGALARQIIACPGLWAARRALPQPLCVRHVPARS
jgi:hypothetical protein